MQFDTTTAILIGVAIVLAIAYFAKRSARIKRERKRRTKSRI